MLEGLFFDQDDSADDARKCVKKLAKIMMSIFLTFGLYLLIIDREWGSELLGQF